MHLRFQMPYVISGLYVTYILRIAT